MQIESFRDGVKFITCLINLLIFYFKPPSMTELVRQNTIPHGRRGGKRNTELMIGLFAMSNLIFAEGACDAKS